MRQEIRSTEAAAAAERRRGRAGTTRPGRNHAKPAHPGNDTSRGGFGVVAGQFPVTIQWTTESGTGSSAANAWISACSTTTAGYPRVSTRGPADRGVDDGYLGGRGAGRRGGQAGRLQRRAAACPAPLRAARPASRVRACSSDVAAIVAGLAVGWRAVAVRVEVVEKPIERIVERVRIETRHLPTDPASAAQIVLRSPRPCRAALESLTPKRTQDGLILARTRPPCARLSAYPFG